MARVTRPGDCRMGSAVRLAGRVPAVHIDRTAGPAGLAAGVGGRLRLWLALGGTAAALIAAHAYALTLPWDQASPWALASHLFAVGLLLGLLWLGTALGLRIVRALGVADAPYLESLTFGLALGLGGLAYL